MIEPGPTAAGVHAAGDHDEVALLKRLFPFTFSVDLDGRLVAVAARWADCAPQVAVGAGFDALFEVVRPAYLQGLAQLRTQPGTSVLLRLRGSLRLELRGQLLEAAPGGVLHFVGGPWVTHLAQLESLRLQLTDFPPHDPRGDMLVMMQVQETALSDLRQLEQSLREKMAEQARLEAQLRQIQKMELVGRLAGGLAHNFNNILGTIQGYSELALNRLPEEEPARAWLQQVIKAVDHAASLTRSLLAMSRQQRAKIERLDMARELDEAQKLVGPLLGSRIELVVTRDPAVTVLEADRHGLKQVLMNLVLNARDAMPDGGRVTIAVRRVHVPGPAGGPPVPRVEMAVSDTGVGMDEATRTRIFEPFFTTKAPGKGLGLGLSTVYGIIDQLGGHIEVQSAPGQGTTFRLLLPAPAEPAPDRPASPAPAGMPGAGARVLLVDDDPAVRDLLREVLQQAGLHVTAAPGPQEALEAVRAQGRFDLLVTDIQMPEMDGTALAVQVEALAGKVPTLFISGHVEDTRSALAALADRQRFLQKPFAAYELVQAALDLLGVAR